MAKDLPLDERGFFLGSWGAKFYGQEVEGQLWLHLAGLYGGVHL